MAEFDLEKLTEEISLHPGATKAAFYTLTKFIGDLKRVTSAANFAVSTEELGTQYYRSLDTTGLDDVGFTEQFVSATLGGMTQDAVSRLAHLITVLESMTIDLAIENRKQDEG